MTSCTVTSGFVSDSIIIIIITFYFRPTTENSEGPYSKYNRIKYRYLIQTQVSVT